MPLIPCPIAQWAQLYPEGLAIITPEKQISYQELDQRINHWCLTFEQQGFVQGDIIGLSMPISVEAVEVFWAFLRLGVISLLINPALPLKTLHALKAETQAKTWLFQEDLPLLKKTSTFSSQAFHTLALKQWTTLIRTSGSSGTPKLAVHTWANYYYSALGANATLPLQVTDRWLLSLPLYHVGGLGILCRVFLAGAALVIAPKSNLDTWIPQCRVTHLSWVPTQLYRAIQAPSFLYEPFKSLKVLLMGGAPLSPQIAQKAQALGFPIYISYGLTEMTSLVTINAERNSSKNALPYREIKLDSTGEVYVKGNTLFQGYFKEGFCTLPLDHEGWFATGDLGHFDTTGTLHIHGRKDNLFISGGENIQPEEVETALLTLDGISQALVIPMDDVEFGKRPIALIDTSPSVIWSSELLKKALKDLLPSYKIPIAFYPWPQSDLSSLKPSRAALSHHFFLNLNQNLL